MFSIIPLTCCFSLPILSFLAPQTVIYTPKSIFFPKRKFSDELWVTCKHILLPSKVFTKNLASVTLGWHFRVLDLGEKLEEHAKKPSIWLRYNREPMDNRGWKMVYNFSPQWRWTYNSQIVCVIFYFYHISDKYYFVLHVPCGFFFHQQGSIRMPERKITYLGPSDLARNATDVPRRKNIDFGWKPQSPLCRTLLWCQ